MTNAPPANDDNPWCRALGIQVPDLDTVVDHPDANTYSSPASRISRTRGGHSPAANQTARLSTEMETATTSTHMTTTSTFGSFASGFVRRGDPSPSGCHATSSPFRRRVSRCRSGNS
jgi:hypothetical protein